MTLKNVKQSLGKISKSLSADHDSREYLLKNTREVVILCSRSIIEVHKGDFKTANKKIQMAKSSLTKLRTKVRGDLHRYLITPEQELVEAISLLAVTQNKEIPSLETMGVSGGSYVLGLLDCIGELKRLVFDKMRVGDAKEAVRIFSVMENLYLNLYPFASYDKIVREARKKLDVNRILVEDTRSALTEETRRIHFIDEMKKLKK